MNIALKRKYQRPKGTCRVCGRSGLWVRKKDGKVTPHSIMRNWCWVACKGSMTDAERAKGEST